MQRLQTIKKEGEEADSPAERLADAGAVETDMVFGADGYNAL